MKLDDLKPAAGSNKKRKRVGRGDGSGHGKTSGRGHKGQGSRSGGNTKPGFEGGQMPLQRRLPKRGFVSLTQNGKAEVRLSDLAKLEADVIDLAALKAANLVPLRATRVKVILGGEIQRKVVLKGVPATKGARAAIEAAGGSIELPPEAAPAGKLKSKKAAAAAVKAE